MRKRRMPDEKLAKIVSGVDFGTIPDIWMPMFEECFHRVLTYEYYLTKIPGNLSLPKYRKIVIRIVYRLFGQVHPSKFDFSKNIQHPDPIIREFMDYLIETEIQRKRDIIHKNPLTQSTIKSLLKGLKSELEIWLDPLKPKHLWIEVNCNRQSRNKMNIDELNAKFDEIYAKNSDIQKLFSELEDHNEILFFLYDTEIQRPNAALNTMIDTYESLIFKIRESHKEIKDSLADFGDEKELSQGVSNNENLTDKVKDLILWKIKRLFMVYDEQPILPYVTGDFLNTDLIGNAPPVALPPEEPADPEDIEEEEDKVDAAEPMVAIESEVPIEEKTEVTEQEEEEFDRFEDPISVDPAGDIFPEPELTEDKN